MHALCSLSLALSHALSPRLAARYVNQIWDLYEDFHVVLMPLLNHEVRGSPKLEAFSKFLIDDGQGAAAGQGDLDDPGVGGGSEGHEGGEGGVTNPLAGEEPVEVD